MGREQENPEDVRMVALVDHVGFGYSFDDLPSAPSSLQVRCGRKFRTNAGRAVRLIEKGIAALDVSESDDAEEIVTKLAEPEAVKVGEPVAFKRGPGRPRKAR